MAEHVLVKIDSATDRQLLEAVYHSQRRLEELMADLQGSVADLQAAVSDLQGRFSAVIEQVQPLKDALAQAQQALVDFQAADTTEDAAFQAAIDTLNQQLTDALGGAQAAADSIESSVADINAVGAVPVPDPVPVEPPVEGV